MRRPGPVAVLFHEGMVGGASIALLRVVPDLAERGWDLRFYVDTPGEIADAVRDLGFEPEGRTRHVGFSLRWLRSAPGPTVKLPAMAGWGAGLTGWLHRTRPALVHANSLYSLPDALIARGLGLPVFLQLLEMLPEGRKGALARRAILRSGITPAVVSEASGRRFAGSGIDLPLVVRTGVPFPERPLTRTGDARPLVVGTLTRVTERKGSDVFVEMARLVRATRNDVEFRLVGPVPADALRDRGEQIVTDARAAGVVYVPHAETYAEIANWDVAVMPSRYDPYPLTVMESMAAGVPTVGSAVDGIIEQIVPGTGLLAPPGDAAGLAEQVTRLLDDPELRERTGRAAREHAEAHFRLSVQAEVLDRAWLTAARR